MSLIVIDAKKLKWKHSGECRKHALKISPRFIALGESFAVEFMKICRYTKVWMRIFVRGISLLFRCCSIHVKLCVLVNILLEIKNLKITVTRAQTMHSGITHER